MGAQPTIGLVEGLLLLSENLPCETRDVEDIHGAENRQSWMLIGSALRCAYCLGLEKVSQTVSELTRPHSISLARMSGPERMNGEGKRGHVSANLQC